MSVHKWDTPFGASLNLRVLPFLSLVVLRSPFFPFLAVLSPVGTLLYNPNNSDSSLLPGPGNTHHHWRHTGPCPRLISVTAPLVHNAILILINSPGSSRCTVQVIPPMLSNRSIANTYRVITISNSLFVGKIENVTLFCIKLYCVQHSLCAERGLNPNLSHCKKASGEGSS